VRRRRHEGRGGCGGDGSVRVEPMRAGWGGNDDATAGHHGRGSDDATAPPRPTATETGLGRQERVEVDIDVDEDSSGNAMRRHHDSDTGAANGTTPGDQQRGGGDTRDAIVETHSDGSALDSIRGVGETSGREESEGYGGAERIGPRVLPSAVRSGRSQ
ncbi:hypothetical protein ABNG03_18145, partial [Halorubrum sp. RMP-47]|uniref:hypothetical protein n=1 Tax=Halorubrum miltondacostae TaxID=3076378 RepID=UPI0035274244